MEMKYLFRKELRDAVEDKYGEFRVYEALRIPCIAQMNESEEFALHPSDLFYHTLFTIDEIKQWSCVDAKKYIRRERYYGTCRRAFYVGEEVTQNDIKAKYDNGILKLFVPKIEPAKVEEEKKFISIEG